jgi:FAD/FMN-containing dehydrogenase
VQDLDGRRWHAHDRRSNHYHDKSPSTTGENIMEVALKPSAQTASTHLQISLLGQAIAPGEPGYDELRAAWNLTVDQHPALIVVAKSAADIAEAVRFARGANLPVAVQATGHGIILPADGSLLIITADMAQARVNAGARTAWISAGTKWGQVLEQTQAVGLAPLLGSSPEVGAIGYTLGGGMGWLARKYGLSIDSVNRFEVVTADGRIVEASETQNSDLFWGLRGGGGGLGVITGMEIRLYPVTDFYGGNLYYPIDQALPVFTRYREWIASAPDELTSSIVIMNYPPLPFLPEPLRGKTFAQIRGAYCGPIEQGAALLKFWRDWQAPLIDDFTARPFSDIAKVSNDPVDPMPDMFSGAWLADLSDETLATLIEYGSAASRPSPLIVTEVRHAGGAIARVDPASNVFGHRTAPHVLALIGAVPTPEAQAALRQHIAQFKQALQPHVPGVYLNFLEGEEARARTREAFSTESYHRLQAIKAKYDPDNRFSHSYDLAADPARDS